MRLNKVHRAFRFLTLPYNKPYIANNLKQQKLFKNDPTQKHFYKLLINAIYSKTIVNVTKRLDNRILTDMVKAKKLS